MQTCERILPSCWKTGPAGRLWSWKCPDPSPTAAGVSPSVSSSSQGFLLILDTHRYRFKTMHWHALLTPDPKSMFPDDKHSSKTKFCWTETFTGKKNKSVFRDITERNIFNINFSLFLTKSCRMASEDSAVWPPVMIRFSSFLQLDSKPFLKKKNLVFMSTLFKAVWGALTVEMFNHL